MISIQHVGRHEGDRSVNTGGGGAKGGSKRLSCPLHARKAQRGSEVIAPLIPNLRSRYKYVINSATGKVPPVRIG